MASLLELTVVGCNNLKDTEWISRQYPYVCVEYASSRNRTRVSTDGGKNPVFQEKFVYSLIQGLKELNVIVWNKNTLTHDNLIGSGKVQLGKVLSQGFDDSSWPLHTKTGRYAGEVRLIMHYSNANANNRINSYTPSYGTSSAPPLSMYSAPPPTSYMTYPPPASIAPYPPAVIGTYPTPSPYATYSYPPTSNSGVFPPPPYPYLYPPQEVSYSTYPPQPYDSHYPHGSSYPGVYPPPY